MNLSSFADNIIVLWALTLIFWAKFLVWKRVITKNVYGLILEAISSFFS